MSERRTFACLGRFGDICNILPMLKAEADAGRRPTLLIAKEFEGILDGVSYCDRIVWNGRNDHLPAALKWLAVTHGILDPIICQTHSHPTEHHRKVTDSYQKEAWRLAGRLDDFASRGPLLFDQRDDKREDALIRRYSDAYPELHGIPAIPKRPILLAGLSSVSSPLRDREAKIMTALQQAYSNSHHIIDLSLVRAERIYDLLGLYAEAACLVSADTLHLHLSRASKVPLVALTNNGWYGSVVEHATENIRYADITLPKVIGAVARVLSPVHA